MSLQLGKGDVLFADSFSCPRGIDRSRKCLRGSVTVTSSIALVWGHRGHPLSFASQARYDRRQNILGDSQGTPTLCITSHRSYKILGSYFLLRCARRWTSKPLRSMVANRCDDHLLDVAPALDDSCCVKRTNMPRASGLGPNSETSNCSFGDIPRQ